MSKFKSPNILVVLNNIRSSQNVGSIFRTCDAVGVKKIILAGYTPTPIDRFGRENKGLTKASLGAEKFVVWEKVESLSEVVKFDNTGSKNFVVVGVEQAKNSINYKNLKSQIESSGFQNLILIFGNEVEGLSESDLDHCGLVAEIPMQGQKESLNVAVCAGIILFELV